MDNSMIFFDRVTKIYGNGQKALDNVSLKVGRGEFVFLEGDSGAGKTTMLELILKETDPTPVSYTHLDIFEQKMLEMRRKSLALCPDCFELCLLYTSRCV